MSGSSDKGAQAIGGRGAGEGDDGGVESSAGAPPPAIIDESGDGAPPEKASGDVEAAAEKGGNSRAVVRTDGAAKPSYEERLARKLQGESKKSPPAQPANAASSSYEERIAKKLQRGEGEEKLHSGEGEGASRSRARLSAFEDRIARKLQSEEETKETPAAPAAAVRNDDDMPSYEERLASKLGGEAKPNLSTIVGAQQETVSDGSHEGALAMKTVSSQVRVLLGCEVPPQKVNTQLNV